MLQKSKAHPVMPANKNLLVDEDDSDVKESARTQSSSSISQKSRDLDGRLAGAHPVVQTKDWDLSPPLFADKYEVQTLSFEWFREKRCRSS